MPFLKCISFGSRKSKRKNIEKPELVESDLNSSKIRDESKLYNSPLILGDDTSINICGARKGEIINMRIGDLEPGINYNIPCHTLSLRSIDNSTILSLNTKNEDFLYLRRKRLKIQDIKVCYKTTILSEGNTVDSYYSSGHEILTSCSISDISLYENIHISKKLESEMNCLTVDGINTNILSTVTSIVLAYMIDDDVEFSQLDLFYKQDILIIDGNAIQKALTFCIGKCTLVPLEFSSIMSLGLYSTNDHVNVMVDIEE